MRTLASIATAAVLALAAPGVSAQETSNYQFDIADPADEATVFNNSGDVLVRVTVVPGLANGDQVELLVDGLPAAPPATTLEFRLIRKSSG